MSGSMFELPVRGAGSNPKFPSSSAASGTSFQFSLPTPGAANSKSSSSFAGTSSGAVSDGKESTSGGSMFRPFTFSTPARGASTAARVEDTAMNDEEMSQIEDDESQYEDDDGASQFEVDVPNASATEGSANANAGLSSMPSFTMNFTPSRPSHSANNNPPPSLSQGFNIQFSLPGANGGSSAPANNVSASAASGPKDYAMADTDMPAGEDAFSHMSDKTGHTAQEHDPEDEEGKYDEGKCSQESDTSRATSRSAGSAYTCETRSVVTAVAPMSAPPGNRTDKSKRPPPDANTDSAAAAGDANPSPSEKEVDAATLARLAEEHEQLTGTVSSAVDKFMTVQNSMRSKLMNAEQEFSSISEDAGSLQVSLAQSLVDLLTLKLQLSIKKVSNHKLVSKLQDSLADSEKTDEEEKTEEECGGGEAMQVAA